MKRQIIILGIVVLLICTGLSGCNKNHNNNPPNTIIEASTTKGTNPLTVNFTGHASDYNGKIVNYWWIINGEFINKRNTSYTFEHEGKYLVKLYVEDENGNKGSDIIEICVNISNNASIGIEPYVEDLDFLAHYLEENHKNLYHTITKEEFYNEISHIKENITFPDKFGLYIEISKLLSKIGDGHTQMVTELPFRYFFPIEIYEFSDGYHVLKIDKKHKQVLGTKLVKINDIPINEVNKLISEVISRDNNMSLKNALKDYIMCANLLLYFKIIDALTYAEFTFKDDEGNHIKTTLHSYNKNTGKDYEFSYLGDEMNIQLPLSLQYTDETYWYTYCEEDKLLFFQYNSCSDNPSLSINNLTDEILNILEEKEVNIFVFDIRYNSGGNSEIIKPFIDSLSNSKNLPDNRKIYVCIGRKTYSSAILNAFYLKDKTNAIFIGEPTGGKPNHYGYGKYFKLPNSQFEISYSSKYFEMIDNDDDSLYPDIEVSKTYNDLINGLDPILEEIKNLELK
jgi:PKD repeat protein